MRSYLLHKKFFAQIGIFLLGFCGSAYVSLTPANSMMNWYSVDDAFYYYKVAQNITSGFGPTFDQINLTNGFHPLWMLICIPVFWLTRFNLILPLRVLILISGILNSLTGVFLYRLLKDKLHPAAAILVPLVWMLLPRIYNITTVHGMETTITAFFLVLFVTQGAALITGELTLQQERKKLLVAGLFGALTILSRLDTVFVVTTIGFFAILKVKRMNRMLVFDLAISILATVFAWLLRFGTTGVVNSSYSIYPIVLTGMIVKPIILFMFGFYNPAIKLRVTLFISKFVGSFVALFIVEYALLWAAQKMGLQVLLSRSVILIDILISLVFIAINRFFYRPNPDGSEIPPLQELISWMKNNLKPIIIKGSIFALPILILVGGYVLFNKISYGTFSPVSGQIKVWWSSLENTAYSQPPALEEMLGLSPNQSNGPWSLLTAQVADGTISLRNLFTRSTGRLPTRLFLSVVLMIYVLLVFLLSRKKGDLAKKSFQLAIPALILGCFFQIAYYRSVGYAQPRPWYWTAEMLTLTILGGVLFSKFFEKTRQWSGRETVNQIIIVLLVIALMAVHTQFVFKLAPQLVEESQTAAYIQPMRELEKYTDEGSLIGMTGGGNVAYFIQNRTIINMDGLINSVEYYTALRGGKGADFLDHAGLDYVYGNSYMLKETDPYSDIFRNRLDVIGNIHSPDNFTLYRYLIFQ